MVQLWMGRSRVASPAVPHLTPEELNALLGRLTEVEAEARTLRAEIEQRLVERRRNDVQDRSGQPTSRTLKKRKLR
jgi:hypothetical protein